MFANQKKKASNNKFINTFPCITNECKRNEKIAELKKINEKNTKTIKQYDKIKPTVGTVYINNKNATQNSPNKKPVVVSEYKAAMANTKTVVSSGEYKPIYEQFGNYYYQPSNKNLYVFNSITIICLSICIILYIYFLIKNIIGSKKKY